jgi:hypothetical protein
VEHRAKRQVVRPILVSRNHEPRHYAKQGDEEISGHAVGLNNAIARGRILGAPGSFENQPDASGAG